MKQTARKITFILFALLFLLVPWLLPASRHFVPGLAVITGIAFSLLIGNPFSKLTGRWTSPLLGATIVGMGCGMNLVEVLKAGGSGFLYTLIGIAAGIGLGTLLGKKFGVQRNTAYLVSVGTAICGGSAIAAAAPALKAKAHEVAIASATVFTLNAAALLLFPAIGHALGFSQSQFGYWAALAIHDTSSVVGATLQYGPEALEIGTTVKLARALWIIPVTLYLATFVAHVPEGEKRKIKFTVPWFIPGFLIAAALVTWIPAAAPAGGALKEFSKYLMVTVLFLIGANLSREKIKELGLRPVMLGVTLWLILSVGWCAVIYFWR